MHRPGTAGFLAVNPNFTGRVFGHSFSGGRQLSDPARFIDVGPVTIDPFPGGECPPGTVDIFGVCVGFGGNGDGGVPGGGGGCPPGTVPNPQGAGCVDPSDDRFFPSDPSPGGLSPGERMNGATPGPLLPSRVPRNVHVCPEFQDGSMGILYMNPFTNAIVCLPRSFSTKDAAAFGLIRKNKPRAKAAVTAADMKLLNKISSIQAKIGRAAERAGNLSCPPKKKVSSNGTKKGLTLAQRKAGFGGKAAQKRAGG